LRVGFPASGEGNHSSALLRTSSPAGTFLASRRGIRNCRAIVDQARLQKKRIAFCERRRAIHSRGPTGAGIWWRKLVNPFADKGRRLRPGRPVAARSVGNSRTAEISSIGPGGHAEEPGPSASQQINIERRAVCGSLISAAFWWPASRRASSPLREGTFGRHTSRSKQAVGCPRWRVRRDANTEGGASPSHKAGAIQLM